MKPTYNHVELMGTIESTVLINQYGDGDRASVSFYMATTATVKNAHGEFEQKPDWHKVTWSRTKTDWAQKLEAGSYVLVIGTLITQLVRSATGETYIAAEIQANQIKLLGRDDFEGHPLPFELKAMGAPVAVEPPSGSNTHPGARR